MHPLALLLCPSSPLGQANSNLDELQSCLPLLPALIQMDTNGIDLNAVFGPVYWGTVISLILAGVTVLQAYTYFPHPTDRIGIQMIAASMAIFDFASTALVVQSVYEYLVPHFGSLLQLRSLKPQLAVDCLLSTIITLISQLYFVAQLYSVTKTGKGRWWIPALIALSATLSFVFGTACTTSMIIYRHDFHGARPRIFNLLFGLAKGFGALTDIVATIAMCRLLSSAKTGMQQTNSLLKSIINYIINRGIVVTLNQTLLLIAFFAAPNRLYWVAFHVNVTKLYANTFFALLNSRAQLKQKHATGISSHSFSKNQPPTSSVSHKTTSKELESQDDNASFQCSMNEMPMVTKTITVSDI